MCVCLSCVYTNGFNMDIGMTGKLSKINRLEGGLPDLATDVYCVPSVLTICLERIVFLFLFSLSYLSIQKSVPRSR